MSRIDNVITAIPAMPEAKRAVWAANAARVIAKAHRRNPLAEGEAPGNLLEGIYLDLPFPAPVLTGPELTQISNGQTLVSTAREFANCLAGYVAEALNGERQFYVWRRADAPAVVFSISAEAPFGWYLSEAKLAENKRLPLKLRRDLHRMLNGCGIRTDGSIEKMMGPYRNDPNPFMMDDFLDLADAA